MRLLVTNDDGIDSVFLHELVFALKGAGHELAVAAPKHEQSWIGAAKSRNRAVATARSLPHQALLGCDVWVIDGTPSDCVNIALAHLVRRTGAESKELRAESQSGSSLSTLRYSLPIDGPKALSTVEGVVSGINVGLNASLGFVLASGTIAGAWEGALHGLPAVAFSQDLTFEVYDSLKYAGGVPDRELKETLQISAGIAAKMATALISTTPQRSFTVHNVNFPHRCRPDAQIVPTVPARVVVPELFSPAQDDGTHRFVFKLGDDVSPPQPLTDRAALAAGFISHTVLDFRALGAPPG